MILPTTNKEEQLLRVGHKFIAGVDEVGRGPLAGPVIAGCVVFDWGDINNVNTKPQEEFQMTNDKFKNKPQYQISNVKTTTDEESFKFQVASPKNLIRDSKLLSEKQRWEAYKWILKNALAWGIGIVSHREIDEMGIRTASLLAMEKAVQEMSRVPDIILIDGRDIMNPSGIDIYQEAIVKGDRDIFSIAAASIIAKVTRDEIMKKIDKRFPRYDFAKHKGYGTMEHRRLIEKYGLCEMHRKSFHVKTKGCQS